MEQKLGAQVSQKAFIQSAGILLALMIVAGILTLVVPAGQFLPRLDPETTGVTVAHPINSYGMKHRQRVNKNNVDLNRNFEADLEKLKSLNPHYESLAALINPARPLKHPLYEKLAFFWNGDAGQSPVREGDGLRNRGPLPGPARGGNESRGVLHHPR